MGGYTLDFLAAAALNPAYGELFRSRVLANGVSSEQSVRAVLSKVRLGEADAGIVYASDVKTASDVHVLTIPDSLNQTAVYALAPLQSSPPAARQFVEFLRSATGAKILTDAGFAVDCLQADTAPAP